MTKNSSEFQNETDYTCLLLSIFTSCKYQTLVYNSFWSPKGWNWSCMHTGLHFESVNISERLETVHFIGTLSIDASIDLAWRTFLHQFQFRFPIETLETLIPYISVKSWVEKCIKWIDDLLEIDAHKPFCKLFSDYDLSKTIYFTHTVHASYTHTRALYQHASVEM